MSEPLRVLMVEDSSDDAELVLREIRRSGFDPSALRVETAGDFERALNDGGWEIILSDYSLPAFSGLAALHLVQSRGVDIPFIIVSGAISEDTAVAAMKSGAHDYVLKDKLARLGPAMARELREAALRRDRQKVDAEFSALREESAAELRRSRDQLDVILRGIAEGVVAQDAQGRIVYVNETAARLNGYESGNEMSGGGIASLDARFEIWNEAGELVPATETTAARALATGVAVEAVVRTRDRRNDDERWHLVTSTPIVDDRRPRMVITIFRDITERKRSEANARFLADLGESLSASLDFEATLANTARRVVPTLADWAVVEVPEDRGPPLLAVAHADVAKTPVLERLAPDDSELFARKWVLQSGRPQLFSHLSVPGHPLSPRSAMTLPLLTGTRCFGTMTLVSTDEHRHFSALDLALGEEVARRASLAIENARLYRQSQQAIAARDEFLSVASHELRTPLTTLLLQLQRLQRGSPTPGGAPVPVNVKRALRQARRLAELIERLLDLSRIRAGRLVLQWEEFDLSALVREVVERLEEDATNAGAIVRVVAPDAVMGQWDRLRMEQVVTNLVSNALRYGAGKPVEVHVSGVGTTATLAVRDQGIGISAPDAARIFERFERAVSSDHYGGLGLGLFIVRQIVEAHGGVIQVASEVGHGSTFTATLPREPSQIAPTRDAATLSEHLA